jgi:hypothetical protein
LIFIFFLGDIPVTRRDSHIRISSPLIATCILCCPILISLLSLFVLYLTCSSETCIESDKPVEFVPEQSLFESTLPHSFMIADHFLTPHNTPPTSLLLFIRLSYHLICFSNIGMGHDVSVEPITEEHPFELVLPSPIGSAIFFYHLFITLIFARNSYHYIFSVIPDDSPTREPIIDIVSSLTV